MYAHMSVHLQVGQNWWLSVWAAATDVAIAEHVHVATHYYLAIYFSLGIVSLAFQFLRGLCLLYGSLNAAQNLHTNLVSNVRSPSPHPTICSMYHLLLHSWPRGSRKTQGPDHWILLRKSK